MQGMIPNAFGSADPTTRMHDPKEAAVLLRQLRGMLGMPA
jgi:hypothetical protein